ncbi:MAG: hypothetical protein AAB439_03830 [Patescibacteria group bacterium]
MNLKKSTLLPFSTLESEKVISTLERLSKRIHARFPDSGLYALSGSILVTAKETVARAERMQKPAMLLRTLIAVVIFSLIGLSLLLVQVGIENWQGSSDIVTLTQGLDAGINLLIVFGAGLWFLMGIEQRVKRGRILNYLHELRSYAHVVDMHQLTKDPVTTQNPSLRTEHVQIHGLSSFQLDRYLDYCSELLSLLGKLAALYAEHVHDPVVVDAVNDIEDLTTNLRRSIWQKIMILGKV